MSVVAVTFSYLFCFLIMEFTVKLNSDIYFFRQQRLLQCITRKHLLCWGEEDTSPLLLWELAPRQWW